MPSTCSRTRLHSGTAPLLSSASARAAISTATACGQSERKEQAHASDGRSAPWAIRTRYVSPLSLTRASRWSSDWSQSSSFTAPLRSKRRPFAQVAGPTRAMMSSSDIDARISLNSWVTILSVYGTAAGLVTVSCQGPLPSTHPHSTREALPVHPRAWPACRRGRAPPTTSTRPRARGQR